MRLAREPQAAQNHAEPYPSEALVLTIEEAAAVLRISADSAYEAARKGEIPSLKIGRRVLVPKKALLQLIDGNGPGGTV